MRSVVPRAARVRAEKARDGARLRLQPLRSAFAFSQRPATLRLDFTRLGCGRATASQVAAAGGIAVVGDEQVGLSVLDAMNFMF